MISEFLPKNSNRCVAALLSLLSTLVLCTSCDLNLQEQTTTLIHEEPVRITHDGLPKSAPAWSPDGTMIAYSSSGNATSFIQVSFLGDEITRIGVIPGRTDIDRRAILAFSPDWTRVAYRREDDNRIWIADLQTNREHLLTSQPGSAYQPTWSPDGRWVAYGVTRDIWIISPDGGLPIQITPAKTSDTYPTWSADATEIAYWSAFTDTVEGRTVTRNVIRVASTTGGDFRQLLPDSIATAYPSWSPDGSTIAFWADINDSAGVWTLPANGGKISFIAPVRNAAHGIAWSPDGSRIAFGDFGVINVVSVNSQDLVRTSVSGIYPNWYKDSESFVVRQAVSFSNINMIRIGDSSATAISTPNDFQVDSNPVWSLDGKVYFSRRRGSNLQIWTVEVQSQEERLVVDDVPSELGVYNVAICGDSKSFLFDNFRDIFLGDLELASVTNLTEKTKARVYDASFSPNCEQFVAISESDVVIYQIEPEMAVERFRIPRLASPEGFGLRGRVAWSPQIEGVGSHIAVEDISRRIFIFSPDNPEPLQVAVGSHPAWSPDGTQLTYVVGGRELYVFKAIVALNN